MKPPPFKLAGDRAVFRELELQRTGTHAIDLRFII